MSETLRDLDIAIAERVMGWQRQPDYNYWMTFSEGGTFQLHALIATWKPSESIEAAMQVVEKMRERGHSVQINGFRRWGVTFVLESDGAPTVRPCGGPSLPEAICRAALAAIGE